MLRVTKDNWVTELVFVSICQQLLNLTRGNTWISPCLRATKNNIHTLMNIPLPRFFCSDSSSPWEKSLCNSNDYNLNLKVQACAQTSDFIDGMRNSPRPAPSMFYQQCLCAELQENNRLLPAAVCLTAFSQLCFAVVRRDGRVSTELPTPHQEDPGFSSSLTPLGAGLRRISLCNPSPVIAFAGCECDRGKVWLHSSEPYHYYFFMFKCVVQSSNVAALCVLILVSSFFLYVALNNNVFLKFFFSHILS